jgi:hypothetical protein
VCKHDRSLCYNALRHLKGRGSADFHAPPKLWAGYFVSGEWYGTYISIYTHTMMPSRGLQAIRGSAPRLYQQQCRNVSASFHAQPAITTNTMASSHRELSPEPRRSPPLTAQSPRRNGGYEAQALLSPSQPSAMPPQYQLRALHQHLKHLSLSPPSLVRPLRLPPPTTSTQSPSTMWKSPQQTTW